MTTLRFKRQIAFVSLLMIAVTGCSDTSSTYVWEGAGGEKNELVIRVDEKAQSVTILRRWTPPRNPTDNRSLQEAQVIANLTADMKCTVVNKENWQCAQPVLNEYISMFQGALSHRVGMTNHIYRRIN